MRGAAVCELHLDDARVILGIILAGLYDFHSLGLRHGECVDDVGGTDDALEVSDDRVDREHLVLLLGEVPAVGDLQLVERVVADDLLDDASHVLGEGHIGLGVLVHGPAGCVDSVGHDTVPEVHDGMLRNLDCDPLLSLHRGCSEVRCGDEVVKLEELLLVVCKGFVAPYVECSACDDLLLQCRVEVVLVDDTSACHVGDPRVGLHHLELGQGDHVPRLGEKRGMDGHEISCGDDLFQRGEPDSERVGHLLGQEGIVSDHGHVEGLHALGDLSSDTSHSDDSQYLSVEFDPGVLGPLPLALVHGLVGEGDVPSDRQEHGAGVLCRGQDVRGWGVHDKYSLVRCVGDVDVVHTDSRTSDDPQFLSGIDDLLGHLGTGPDDQCIVIADLRTQLILCQSGNLVHGESRLLQYLETLCIQGIRYQNLRRHFHSSNTSSIADRSSFTIAGVVSPMCPILNVASLISP